MSTNEKGTIIPPRTRPNHQSSQDKELTDAERTEKVDSIINDAPLRSTDMHSTNTKSKQKKQHPWRNGIDLPSEALMQITKKTSFSQAKELELRLNFILNEMNNKRGFNKKMFITDLITQALDQFTIEKLNEMGYTID